MRAASPGREPCCSLPAKYRPASLCSDASRNRELPLSPSSPLRARTPSCFAEPSPAFCICLRGSAAAPSPPLPSALRRQQAHFSALLSVLRSEPPTHRGIRLGSLSPSRSQPSTPVPGRLCPCSVGSGTGALCPAVLQRAQGRARVSPPRSSFSNLSVKRRLSPPFFMAPLLVARENALYATPCLFCRSCWRLAGPGQQQRRRQAATVGLGGS